MSYILDLNYHLICVLVCTLISSLQGTIISIIIMVQKIQKLGLTILTTPLRTFVIQHIKIQYLRLAECWKRTLQERTQRERGKGRADVLTLFKQLCGQCFENFELSVNMLHILLVKNDCVTHCTRMKEYKAITVLYCSSSYILKKLLIIKYKYEPTYCALVRKNDLRDIIIHTIFTLS